jgi:hypothetical protein
MEVLGLAEGSLAALDSSYLPRGSHRSDMGVVEAEKLGHSDGCAVNDADGAYTVSSSMSLFLFLSFFQVHNKSILLPLLPMTPLLSTDVYVQVGVSGE